MDKKPSNKLGWLVLFTTSSTLICCALPIVFVSIGMGAAVASIASNAPWLVWLTANKLWVFILSGLILLITWWTIYIRKSVCPADRELGQYCERVKKWNVQILWISVGLWLIGFTTAYLLPFILYG